MMRDRAQYPDMRQLFVSRSKRLSEFVQSCQQSLLSDATMVSNTSLIQSDFFTLDKFLVHMGEVVSRERGDGSRRVYMADKCVDFK